MFSNPFEMDIKEYQEDYELEDQFWFGKDESNQWEEGINRFYFTSFL